MDKCRCADCGFLAIRNTETTEILEVDRGKRKDWFRRNTIGVKLHDYDEVPICFAQKLDFTTIPDADYKKAITEDRECDGFTIWQVGLTPKEHRQMVDGKWLREFSERCRKEERDWQEQRHQDDLAWRANQEARVIDRWRFDTWWQRFGILTVGIVGTLILAVAQIAAALIPLLWNR